MSTRQHNSPGLLCKHRQVVQIASEPGFEYACSILCQVSLKCLSQCTCECKGYEAEYVMAMAVSAPEAAAEREPAVCAEMTLDLPQGDIGQSQERITVFSHILDRVSAWIVRALPRLHIEDDKLKV